MSPTLFFMCFRPDLRRPLSGLNAHEVVRANAKPERCLC